MGLDKLIVYSILTIAGPLAIGHRNILLPLEIHGHIVEGLGGPIA